MRRLVFIVGHFYSEEAGTENQLGKIIRGLSTRFDIELIVFRDSEWLRTRAGLPCRLRIFQIDNFTRAYTYRNMIRLVRHLRALRPDVVHTFLPVANIIGVLCARAAGVPAIVASRRDYGEWMSTRYLYATRVANFFASGIVANSHEVKRLTERVEKFPGERIEVIYNGISLQGFDEPRDASALRRALGIPAGNKVVGLVANYRPMKRHDTFILAAQEILRVRSDVSFVLLGKDAQPGEPKKKIQQMVDALGLTQNVHFAHASGGDVKTYLSMFDVGVNCSVGEGLSNAIMEYMVARVPCVVSASGGNPDLISDDVHGYTFPAGDHRALAQKVLRLLDDGEARARLSTQARAKIHAQMSLEAMLNHFERYYTSLALAREKSGKHARKTIETENPP